MREPWSNGLKAQPTLLSGTAARAVEADAVEEVAEEVNEGTVVEAALVRGSKLAEAR